MKTNKTVLILAVSGAIALRSFAQGVAAKTPSFEWTNRLELTIEQQKLLHVCLELEDSNWSAEKRQQFETEVKRISTDLGTNTVRRAKPGELIVTSDKSGISTVFNPSEENVAFTISVKGDEQWMGTRKASMGRLTYLPPKGVLRVPNLYWTTPRMSEKN
jgi:hypothetical protein